MFKKKKKGKVTIFLQIIIIKNLEKIDQKMTKMDISFNSRGYVTHYITIVNIFLLFRHGV